MGLRDELLRVRARNSRGLQIPFFHDDELGAVVAELNLSNDFSGAPQLLHGGLTLAVLDEAQAWACIAVAHQWAVTSTTTTRFLRPVHIDRPYQVVARIEEVTAEAIRTSGQVLDERARCAPRARPASCPWARPTPCGRSAATSAIGGLSRY